MEGTIVNFRRSMHTTSTNQMVIAIDGVDSLDKARELVGKKVAYNTGKKDIQGEIKSSHGNKGAVRVLFETGMPGQAISKKVKVN